MNEEISKTFSAWSDVGSLVLVASCGLVGRLDPRSPIWGYSPRRKFLLFLLLLFSSAWSLFRFIQEGIFRDAGPREFLAANVIYVARWAYLWMRMRWWNTKEKRLYDVARALRRVHNVRLGTSTLPSRSGQVELVLRKGVKDPKAEQTTGISYWRGVIKEQRQCPTRNDSFWYVELLQKHLHHEELDQFGTIDFLNPDKAKIAERAYKHFYDVIMTAVAFRKPDPTEDGYSSEDPVQSGLPLACMVDGKPTLEVSFQSFINERKGLNIEAMAKKVDATDPRMIGRVARRIAADACVYVTDEQGDAKFRTERQVELLNQCLQEAVDHVLQHGVQSEAGQQQDNSGPPDNSRSPDNTAQPGIAAQLCNTSRSGSGGGPASADQSNSGGSPNDSGRPSDGGLSNQMAQANENGTPGSSEVRREDARGTENEVDRELEPVQPSMPDIESGRPEESAGGEVQSTDVGRIKEATGAAADVSSDPNQLRTVVVRN